MLLVNINYVAKTDVDLCKVEFIQSRVSFIQCQICS